MTDDEKIAQRYRELGAEEPPRALDDAILAAARRGRRPQRWYAPLATAAVLVLAVAVALQMQIEQPEAEAPVALPRKEAAPAAQPPAPVVADSAPKQAPQRARPKAEAPAKTAEPPGVVPEPAPHSTPVPATSASGAIAGGSAERDARADRALSVAETPDRALERIAALRAQGRQEEADRALADFRKRYPEYKIPEDMRLRVERR